MYCCKIINAPKGFTLTELLICLLIVSLIAVISVPSLLPYKYTRQANNTVFAITQAFQRARGYALTLNQEVHLCGASEMTSKQTLNVAISTCSPVFDRIVLFVDTDLSGDLSLDDTVLESVVLNLKYNAVIAKNNRSRDFSFYSTGRLKSAQASIFYCPGTLDSDDLEQYGRTIVISLLGRVRVNKGSNKKLRSMCLSLI